MNRREAREVAASYAERAAEAERTIRELRSLGLSKIVSTEDHFRVLRAEQELPRYAALANSWAAVAALYPEPEPYRCYSCDHEEADHEAGGCLKELLLVRQGVESTRCPCAAGAVLGRVVDA